MRFEDVHTYEVWQQIGGFTPKRTTLRGRLGKTKEECEEFIAHARERELVRRASRPEAAPIHYLLVCASTTRREVH